MAQKAKKTKKTTKKGDSTPWTTTETRGFLLLSSSIVLLLSLISFSMAPEAKNLLGLMGYSLGWAFLAIFGLSSYFLVIYIGWIGWRLLFSKPINHLWLKNIYLSVSILSISMLLSLVESDYPSIGNAIGASAYPGLWVNKFRYHLGGAPFHYLYQDLPNFNMNHVFNTVGGALIFSTTLIASILFLFKIRLIHICRIIIEQVKKVVTLHRETRPPIQLEPEEKKQRPKEGAAEPSQESDFLRFVKLRIPSSSIQEGSLKATGLNAGGNDMLGIQPEKNLKVRPSMTVHKPC